MKIFFVSILIVLLGCSEEVKQSAERMIDSTKPSTQQQNFAYHKGISLKINPKVGQVFTFKTQIDQNIQQTFDTIKVNTLHNQTFVYSLFTKSNNPSDGIIFDVVYRSIQQKIKTPIVTISANSESKDNQNNPLDYFYKILVGKGFRLQIKENGKKVQLYGLDSISSEVFRTLSKKKQFTPSELEGLKQITQEFFNPEELKKNFEKTFEILPDSIIHLHSKWKTTKTVAQPIPTQIFNEYTLDKISGDTFFVSVNSNFIFKKPSQTISNQPNIKKMSGNQTGEIKLDKNTGMTLFGNFFQQVNIEYELPPTPQTNNKVLTVPMNVRTNFNFELIDDKK